MERIPATTSTEPPCFGTRVTPRDRKCAACPIRAACVETCRWWIDQRSIRQAEAESTSTAPSVEGEDSIQTVKRLARWYFGKTVAIEQSLATGIHGVVRDVSASGRDINTWICAQLEGIRHVYLLRPKMNIRLSIGHFRGQHAENRYKYYISQRNARRIDMPQRHKQVEARKVDGNSFEVSEFIRVVYLDGIDDPALHPEFAALTPAAQHIITDPNKSAHIPAVLRAACDFLGWLHPGADQRIMMPLCWDWTSFIAFVRVLFPPVPAAQPAPAHLGGVSLGSSGTHIVHRSLR